MKLTVWGTSLIMLVLSHWLSTVIAAELESLRLFHEPAQTNAVDAPFEKHSRQASAVEPNPIAVELKSKSVARATAQVEYRYNGFIKTNAGVFHFVNGVPIAQLKNIELVSSSDKGRSVQLVTRHGYEFTVSVGNAIQVPKGPVDDNHQQAVGVASPKSAIVDKRTENTP